ncbi:hypothetical protein SCHPADRAFT_1002788 [Schizopora paradoxa]|uniref:HAM1-like N-terminal domain-containing protein n=1 Tax=Schizopora paradoxa TaxID=27342 RepID=A0A0H2R1K8_9AGAM|nr:hypothetical protein SCHPADRAFT_1002788 [Schizopora paradoxa]
MGLCFSCCRRRKPVYDPEQDPLLKSESPTRSSRLDGSPRTHLEKMADVVAAIEAGKLPSQDQLNNFGKELLAANFLKKSNASGMALDADLAAESERLVDSAREALEAILQMGIEKNDDNRLQDLFFTIRRLNSDVVKVDVPGPKDIAAEVPTDVIQNELGKVATAIPSEDELAEDTKALIRSIRTISSLLLTSSAFRFILSDILRSARDYISDVALKVKAAAQQVEAAAGAVDEQIRPVSPGYQVEIPSPKSKGNDAVPRPTVPDKESMANSETSILDRVELIILQAQSLPMYNSALRTILFIIRKYSTRVRLAAEAASKAVSETADATNTPVNLANLTPIISPDPSLGRALEDIRIILERFASGYSLDPLLTTIFEAVNDIAGSPEQSAQEAHEFFGRVGSWLDRALSTPDWASSRAGRKEAEDLYDQGMEVLGRDGAVSDDLNRMLDEADTFIEAMKNDRTTRRLVSALSSCSDQFSRYAQQFLVSSGQAVAHWKLRLVQSLLAWVVPKALRAIKTVPMPRVEYMNMEPGGQQLAVVIDALLMQAQEELVPDELKIIEWGEISVNMRDRDGFAFSAPAAYGAMSPEPSVMRPASPTMSPAMMSPTFRPLSPGPDGDMVPIAVQVEEDDLNHPRTTVQSSSRLQIHISGLRLAAYDVGYFAKYNYFSWLGYEDEGLLTATVGKPGKERDGLSLDIDLEFDSSSEGGRGTSILDGMREHKLFRVRDVRVDLPGLAIYIRKSRHWLLNALLAPFAGPIGRLVGSRVLASQVRSLLEKLEETMRNVKTRAENKAGQRRRAGTDAEVERAPTVTAEDWWLGALDTFGQGGSSNEEGDEEQDAYSQTFTSATTKGIVRTTYTQPEPPSAQEGEAASVPNPSESVLAIGMGAQVLPGKGEPTSRESLKEVGQDVAGEFSSTGHETEERIIQKGKDLKDGVYAATEARKQIDNAGERMENKARQEGWKKGWQSKAFDMQPRYRDS